MVEIISQKKLQALQILDLFSLGTIDLQPNYKEAVQN